MNEFEIPENSPCYHCERDLSLALDFCPDCENEVPPRFTLPQLLVSFTQGLIIDARFGGLVIGRDTPEDDIPMYLAIIPGVIQLAGLIHGGEFIVNSKATFENLNRVKEINDYKDSKYTPMRNIPLSPKTRIFNTNGTEGKESNIALLIQTGQFIVNRSATSKYFSELVEINSSANPKLG